MENKPDTEKQAQNTQTGIGPVTATQPPGESPDAVVGQRTEPLEYIRVEDIHGWPVYFQNGHEDESPDVIMRQHKLAQDYAQVTGKQQPPLYLLIGHEDEFQSEIDEIRLRNLSNHGSESTQDKETTPPDDIWGAAWNTAIRSYEGTAQLYNQHLFDTTSTRYDDRRRTFDEIIEDTRKRRFWSINRYYKYAPQNILSAVARLIDARYAEMIGTDDDENRRYYADKIGHNVAAIKNAPKSVWATEAQNSMFVDGATLGETFENIGSTIINNPVGFLAWSTETSGENAPKAAALWLALYFKVNPSFVFAADVTSSSIAERYKAPADFYTEKGLDLTKPEDVQRLLDDPNIQNEAISRGQTRAILLTWFQLGTAGFGAKYPLKNDIAEAFSQTAIDAFGSMLGEYSARLGAGQDINWGEIIASGLPHVAKTTFDIGKATVKTYRDHRKAVTADQTISVIDKLSQKAQGPDLRKLSPEEFERRVERATKGTPAENMYVDANTLSNMLETNGRDPYEFTEKIGLTRQQFDEARSSGGDIKISTAKFAGRVADDPDNAAIKKHMRFGPDDMSHAQAQEHLKNFDKLLSDARIEDKKANQAAETNVVPSDISTSVSQSNAATSPSSEKQNNNSQHSVDRETRTTADAERARRVVRDLLHSAKNKPSGTNRKKNVGRAGDSVVQAVRDATGLDISNSQHSLGTTTIRDTLNTKHPDPQRQVVQADVEAIPDITSSADRIISGAKNSRGQPIIGYIKHMSDGRTLYLEQTRTGPKTFTVNGLTKYPAGTDLDTVSQTVLSDVRAKNGDSVKMTPVKKGDTQPAPQEKAGGKRTSASESRVFDGSGTAVIQALIGAGLTEVAHQGVSYFLEHQQDMAERGEQTAIAAMARLNDWWGQNAKTVANLGAQTEGGAGLSETDGATVLGAVATGTTTKTAAVHRGLQTQFSHAFETYLLEGKVPSPELADTFETARKWLTTAYRTVTALGGKTSPEVAEVFNRMLVSDGQLEMARLDAGESAPVFSSAEAMGLSEAAYADFTAARRQSEDEASAEMLKSVMQPVRREQDKAYAQEKAAVRTQVEEQVNTQGHYRAIELMSNRRWLGDGVAPANFGDIRFDKAILVERYGDEILNVLPRGSQTVYTDKDGLDPDDVASIFGYSSGDELLRLMVMAPSRNDRIDGETARIMRERHGDPLYDGTADLKAMDAIHNTSRGQWLETELKAVGRVSKTPQDMTLKDAHISAKATISDMSVQDAAESKRFLAAERRAAEEAERLAIQLSSAEATDIADVTATPDDDAPDVDTQPGKAADKNEIATKLYTAKRRQLLNHALYVESRAIAREVEEMEAYVQSLTAPERREHFFNARQYDNGLINYNDALNDLLARYDLSSVESAETGFSNGRQNGQLAGLTGALDEFIDQMKAAGRENELAISDSVVSATTRLSYRKLPLQTFRDVINSLKNLEHSALRAGKLVDAEQTRDFEETVAGVLSAFAQTNADPMMPGIGDTPVVGHGNRPRPYFDAGMNADVALRELDGSRHGSDVQSAIKAPVDAAITRLAARKQKAASELAALYDVYSPQERQDMARRVHVPQLGYSLSKWDMIAVALNTGTAENRKQLMDVNNQDALNQAQVSSVLGFLDPRDADFIQSVWDYAGSFNADIAARETRVTGVAPQWVEATPVVIGGKKLAGGYYPLRGNGADGAQWVLAGRFAKAQTDSHHGSQGMNEAASPVELDMSVLHRHINELVHDLELSEALSNSRRLLQDQRIQMAFIHTGKGADHAMLQGWLRDAATGDMAQAELVSSMARLSKDNGTATRLAGDLGAALSDSSSLSSAISLIGHQGFADGLQHVMRPGVLKRITNLSPYMAARLPAGDGNHAAKDEPLDRLASWVSQRLQYQMVDAPVWLAAYHQGLQTSEQHEAKAIAHADTMVQQAANSSGNAGGNASSPNQQEVLALLTALGSFMTAKSHMNQNRQAEADMLTTDPKVNGMSLAIDLVSLFHAQTVLRAAADSQPRPTDVSVMEALPFMRDGKSSGGTRNLANLIRNTVGNQHLEQPEIAAILKATALAHDLPVTQIASVVDARMQQFKGQGGSLLDYHVARSA